MELGLNQIISSLICMILPALICSAPEHGWGSSIDWIDLDSALKESKTSHKPIMLILHQNWCGACKSLKADFSKSSEIVELSRAFHMVNMLGDDEPAGGKFQPDGAYYPRLMFLDPDGQVQKELYNIGGNAQYKYFYFNSDSVVKAMKTAINSIKHHLSDVEL